MTFSLDPQSITKGRTSSTDAVGGELTNGREFFSPLDDLDIEAIESRCGIGIHSKVHDLRQHLKVATLEGIMPSDSLASLATKTDTHDGVDYMPASRFSELTNGRTYRAAAEALNELLHTPQFYYQRAQMRNRLDWLNREVVAVDASNLSLKAPVTVSSQLREIDETRDIQPEDGGLKLHVAVRVDGKSKQPLSAVVTPPETHENTQFDKIQANVDVFADIDDPIEVWDRGYTDYDRFVEKKHAGDDFVTLLKSNANTTLLEHRETMKVRDASETRRVTDDIIELSETGESFRRVTVEDSDDEITEYLTTLPPTEYDPIDIVSIYTLRTMIEIFFRESKQYTNVQNFHSTTLNGVLFELFCTLIAYLLMELYRDRHPLRGGARNAIRTIQLEWNQSVAEQGKPPPESS